MAGDEISASTQYYYKTDITNTGSSNIAENVIASLLAALTGGGSNFLQQKTGNIGSQLSQNGSFGNFVQPLEGTIGSAPKAYLSVLFFDERFNFIPEGSGQLRATDADNSNANLSLLNLKAPKNGYAYIYVSNSSDVSVYFDNLKVAHNRGRIVEENHYYAFGLRIAAISSKKLADQTGNEGNATNSYLYNDKELFEEGDLGWYDYGFRQYDAQIGRFIEIDPLTDDYFAQSGYIYALNDPIKNIDVDGLFPGEIFNAAFTGAGTAAKELTEVVVTSVRKVSHAVTSSGASSFLSKLGGVLKQGGKNIVHAVVDGAAHVSAGMLGAANAWTSNQFLGVGRTNALKQGLTDSKGFAFQVGQKVGDAVSVVTGALEWGASGVAEVASLGWATPVAIPVAAHGTTAIGMGLYNLINGQIVYSTSKENTGGSSSGSSNSPKKYSSEPPTENAVKLKNGQGWKDKDGNFWRKDMKHKDHWDVTDAKTGKKLKEVDFDGNQIWPNGPKNKNKT